MDNGNKWASRIVSYAAASPAALRLNPANWRTHPSHQQEALAGTLDEIGWIDDVIINQRTAEAWGDEQGSETVLDGHLRVKLAQERGEGSIPVKYVDLDPGEEALALATFDPLAALATADRDRLGELLDSITIEDERVLGMLEGLAETHGLELGGGEPLADPGPQVDRAAELQEIWQTELGQVWELGEHRLACGDCTDAAVVERVMRGERARYGMHDPPYGIDVVGGSKPFGSVGGSNAVRVGRYEPIEGDSGPFDPSYVLEICPNSVLWGANYYADRLPSRKGWVVWDKKGRDWKDTFSDCELAWTPFPITTRIYRHVWMGMVQEGEREERVHPTQKPAALFAEIIQDLFVEGGLIIDFFLGSGTTLIACERLGRRCRAIEIEPKYVAVALQRWADMTGKEPRQV